MAEKRMFTQKIIDSDAFLDMPLSAQALYFHLNMRADDDGFVNNPKRITKLVNASEDDLKILLLKRFIIGFASGVIVIKHWRMHNTLKSDRYKPTQYQEELAMLGIKTNKSYTDHPEQLIDLSSSVSGTRVEPEWNQSGTKVEPQNSIDSGLVIEESSKEENSVVDMSRMNKRFSPPSIEDVSAYCKERNNGVDPQRFIDYYTANGWKVGKNSMKDWKAAVRTWERNGYDIKSSAQARQKKYFTADDYAASPRQAVDMDELRKVIDKI